jgi:hypothetical protein
VSRDLSYHHYLRTNLKTFQPKQLTACQTKHARGAQQLAAVHHKITTGSRAASKFSPLYSCTRIICTCVHCKYLYLCTYTSTEEPMYVLSLSFCSLGGGGGVQCTKPVCCGLYGLVEEEARRWYRLPLVWRLTHQVSARSRTSLLTIFHLEVFFSLHCLKSMVDLRG